MKYYEDLVQTLNRISFEKCPGISIGDCLYHVIRTREDGYSSIKEIVLFIKQTLSLFFLTDMSAEEKGNADSLFFLANTYKQRIEIKSNFDRIVRLSNHYIYLFSESKKRLVFHRIRFFPLLNKWIRQMKKAGISLINRLYFTTFILEAFLVYVSYEEYAQKNHLNIQRLITFNDVQHIDSFFTQKFNYEKKDTITLQHGVFSSKTNDWAFRGSHSKYLLANSRFTIDESHHTDYTNTILIAGLYSFVNNEPKRKEIKKPLEIIGLCLDGDMFLEDNQRMIDIISSYCERNHKEMVIRFHPTSNRTLYKLSGGIVRRISEETNLFEYFSHIDIVIIRNSTILFEATQYGLPVYIIHDDQQKGDLYQNIQGIRFETEEELHQFLDIRDTQKIQNDTQETRKSLGLPENVTENYRRIFQTLHIS